MVYKYNMNERELGNIHPNAPNIGLPRGMITKPTTSA